MLNLEQHKRTYHFFFTFLKVVMIITVGLTMKLMVLIPIVAQNISFTGYLAMNMELIKIILQGIQHKTLENVRTTI